MGGLFTFSLVLVWLAGTLTRIYQQAHYYQIEEYKSGRYVRWLSLERIRWLPSRAMVALAVSLLFIVLMDSVPGGDGSAQAILAVFGALVAVVPARKASVKKPFVRTQRAIRLLGGAFVVAILIALGGWVLLGDNGRTSVVLGHVGGMALFLLAPVWLMVGNVVMIPVEASLRRAFEQSARAIMAEVRPKVIGITGSYGKTTTKNYVRDFLNIRYKAYATPKSYNTLMGLCIAINRDVRDDYSLDYFIAEMGMYDRGEIARLCAFTPPDIGLVIEVGPQHLERAGSMENIARAKYEIIEGLAPDGVGVFNWDNAYIREMVARGYPDTQLCVSKEVALSDVVDATPRFIATDISETTAGLSFKVHDMLTGACEDFETSLHGEHNVTNLLMAVAVAVYEGVPLKDIARRARTLTTTENRLTKQAFTNGITILNDSYSANPIGARSALQVLGMHASGRRLLVTPGMVELGDKHEEENHRLGVLATQYATDIILVGDKQTRPIQDGIRTTDFDMKRLQVVSTVQEAIAWYQTHLDAGDTVLLLNDLPDTY